MQQYADFITADFLYMLRASCAHHQEYKILTRQPPVQVVMVAGGPHFAILGTKRTFVPNIAYPHRSPSARLNKTPT